MCQPGQIGRILKAAASEADAIDAGSPDDGMAAKRKREEGSVANSDRLTDQSRSIKNGYGQVPENVTFPVSILDR
jgi:hypothetical protein